MTIEKLEFMCNLYNKTLTPNIASIMIGKLFDSIARGE